MWFLSRLPRGSRAKGSAKTTFTDMRGPVACAVLVQELRKFRSLARTVGARGRPLGDGGLRRTPRVVAEALGATMRIQPAMAARNRAFDDSNVMTSINRAALNAYGYSGRI